MALQLEAQSALAEPELGTQDAVRFAAQSSVVAGAELQLVVPDAALLAYAQQAERQPQAEPEFGPQAA